MSTTTLATLAAATVGLELSFDCEACGRPLEPVEFGDGGRWSIRGLASHAKRRHKAILCWSCFMAASRAARGVKKRLPTEPGAQR